MSGRAPCSWYDIQSGLLPVIEHKEQVRESAAWLLRLAGKLQVPVVVSEHSPRRSGQTVPELYDCCRRASVRKTAFSAVRDGVLGAPRRARRAGDRGRHRGARLCAADGGSTCSRRASRCSWWPRRSAPRRAEDRLLALERMRQAGAVVVCREMVAFEWLERGGTDLFRDVLRTLIR